MIKTMQSVRFKEEKKSSEYLDMGDTYCSIREFSVNSRGILIKMLQVKSGKIKMNSKPHIYVQIYTYSWPCMSVGVRCYLWNRKGSRRTILVS